MRAVGYIFIFPLLLKVIMCKQKETDALERKLDITAVFCVGSFPPLKSQCSLQKALFPSVLYIL